MSIEHLAEKIMVTALSAGACNSTAGRGMGLTALARDARQAAEVLLGLKVVEGGQDFRPEGAPKIGRPRKLVVAESPKIEDIPMPGVLSNGDTI